jgi:hypothetical protein
VQYSHSLCLMLENCGHLPMIRSFWGGAKV